MGNSKSKAENYIENTINDITKIVTENVVENKVYVSTKNKLNFNNCNLIDTDIQQNNIVTINTESINNSINSAEIDEKIKLKTEQQAENIKEGMNLDSNSQQSKNINKIMLNLSKEIINVNRTNCIANLIFENDISCKDSELDTVKITQESIGEVIVKCYQDAVNESSIKKDLKSITDQSASAETEGFDLFGDFGMYIIIGIAAFFILNKGLDPMIIIIVAAILYYFFVYKKNQSN